MHLLLVRVLKIAYFFFRSFLTFLSRPGSRCRFFPSCGFFFFHLLEKYGWKIAFKEGLGRLFLCHPLTSLHSIEILEKKQSRFL